MKWWIKAVLGAACGGGGGAGRARKAYSTSPSVAIASVRTPRAVPGSSAASSTTCSWSTPATWREWREVHLVGVRDRIRRGARCGVLRAAQEGLERRAGRVQSAQRRHRLRADRPRHDRQEPGDHHQPRAHRLDRWPRLPIHLPAAATRTARSPRSSTTLVSKQAATPRSCKRQENRHAVPRLPVRQRDHPGARYPGQEVRLRAQHIEVPHPGNEQQAQWLQIRQRQARLRDLARLGCDEPSGD